MSRFTASSVVGCSVMKTEEQSPPLLWVSRTKSVCEPKGLRQGGSMELDTRTKGQLGLKGAQGMWQRLELFKRSRKPRQSTATVERVSTSKPAPKCSGKQHTWVGTFTTPGGETRKRVYKDCSRGQAGKIYAEQARRNKWTPHALSRDEGW